MCTGLGQVPQVWSSFVLTQPYPHGNPDAKEFVVVSFKDCLDAAKVLAGIAAATTATGPIDGATVALTASGAAHDLSERLAHKPDLQKRIQNAIATDVNARNLTDNQRTILIQMVERSTVSPAQVMECARNPQRIAEAMQATLTERDYTTPDAVEVFRTAMTAVLTLLLRDKVVLDELRPEFEDFVADRLAHISAQLDRLAEQLDATAQKLGLAHGLVIGVARSYATGDAKTFDQALRSIERALREAAEMKSRGDLPQNLDDQLQAVMRRVSDLNDQGRIEDGAEAVDEALRRNEAEKLALLDLGIRQDRVRNNPASAAARVLVRTRLEVGGPPFFPAFRKVFTEWCVRGSEKGQPFDLEVSVALAREALAVAADSDQRGAALHNAGSALSNLGRWESAPNRLLDAISAFRAALMERTRDRVPLDWAMSVMNLGNALQALGKRETDSTRLKQAVAAYREALLEMTRERAPLDWARLQMNLGSALATLGERERNSDLLLEAIIAHRAALLERTRERDPMDWATSQANLGTTLWYLARREIGNAQLLDAIVAHRAALEVRTRDRVPLDWAMSQMNLGNALRTLGEREAGTAYLYDARAAYVLALEERDRDRFPLDWATTKVNLCGLEISLFDKTKQKEHLDLAEIHGRAARQVFVSAGASQYLQGADSLLVEIAAKRRWLG